MSLGKVKAITYPTTILKLAFWREHCHLYSSLTLSTTTTLLLRNQSLAVPGVAVCVEAGGEKERPYGSNSGPPIVFALATGPIVQ